MEDRRLWRAVYEYVTGVRWEEVFYARDADEAAAHREKLPIGARLVRVGPIGRDETDPRRDRDGRLP